MPSNCTCNTCRYNTLSGCAEGHDSPIPQDHRQPSTCYRGRPGHRSCYELRLAEGLTHRQALAATASREATDAQV